MMNLECSRFGTLLQCQNIQEHPREDLVWPRRGEEGCPEIWEVW